MTLPCPVTTCDRPMPGNLRVCRACSARLIRDLADVPDLATHLDIAITRQARIGEPGAGHTELPDPAENEIALTIRKAPLPWDPRVREAADVLKSALVGWKRVLSEGAPLVSGPICPDCEHPSCEWTDLGRKVPDTLTALSRWLIRHRVRLLRHPATPEAIDELGAAVRQARRAIDLPPGVWYAGPCGADTGNGECPAGLYARHGAATMRCRTCGATHDVGKREAWLLDQVRDRLGTATEIARALSGFATGLTASKIRGLAYRGRIVSHGDDELGRPLYRIGDVLRLVTVLA